MSRATSKPRKAKRVSAIQKMEKAGPSREELRRLAKTSRPPQSWFDQTDNPFEPERR